MDLGIAGRRAAVSAGSKGLGFAPADALARSGVRVAICHPMDDDARLLSQAEAVLAVNPGVPGEQPPVWVYRPLTKIDGDFK